MTNKVKQSLAQAGDGIPEPRVRKFVSAAAKRAKKRTHAAKCAKQRRKAGKH